MAAIYLSHVRSSLIVTLGTMSAYRMLALQNQKEADRICLTAVGLLISRYPSQPFLAVKPSRIGSCRFRKQSKRLLLRVAASRSKPRSASRCRVSPSEPDWLDGAWYPCINVLSSKALFAEVQPAAWILDGGVPLLIRYSLALFSAVVGAEAGSASARSDRPTVHRPVAANIGTLVLVMTFAVQHASRPAVLVPRGPSTGQWHTKRISGRDTVAVGGRRFHAVWRHGRR